MLNLLSSYVLMLFFKIWNFSSIQVFFSFCDATFRDPPEILSFKSVSLAEFSYYRFSRKQIDIQPNELCSGLFHSKAYLTLEYETNCFFWLLPPCYEYVRFLATFVLNCHQLKKVQEQWVISLSELKSLYHISKTKPIDNLTIQANFVNSLYRNRTEILRTP